MATASEHQADGPGRPGPTTLRELLDSAARARPRAVAVRGEDAVLTYGELHERVRATARRFEALGVTGRGAAGLLLENTPDSVVALLAAARLGVRLVPLEPGTTRTQLGSVREALGPLSVMGHTARLAALEGAEGPDPLDCAFIPIEDPGGDTPSRVPEGDAAAMPDAPFLHQYTSGSTGEPKVAVHTQRNLVNGGDIYARSYGITEDDRILAAVPLLHSFGLVAGLVTALRAGAELVLLGRFTPARLLRALEEHACTVLVAAPMAYDLTTRAAGASPSVPRALRLCLSSGAALPPAVARRAKERLGLDIQQVYGCTEAGVIAARRPEDGSAADLGVGRPMPGVRIRVVDERGDEVARGEEGALLVRTPAMFTHYLGHADATREAFADGWYRTGDVARVGPEGHLHLVGRKDSFINVGGKKVNPLEVEQALLAHPSVVEAVVWGETTDDGGERVRASVVARPPLPATELTSHCRARLLPHQVPAEVDFVASLPKSSMGKIRRAAVRTAAAVRRS
ncbi:MULTISPECIES: class I adenylate-forming enzyme family protein [Streptomyces]|nr:MULTISPECIES: class I adenylate-forming enzyme family protein [Streptomyces]MYY86849.1 AMP-binding protein [Streptomyces sp. SID335]MYZ11926.1 AMP-binding protein [Streptomyces sp. SID337]NDZ89850.1 acyl--CoA ligase [Streptomyces sp. SID10115]NEB46063.1 acyl--CoA ligase [Streptomyces sp. SID339]QEG98935.1 Ant22 [Streptomyces venezuelae]